MIVPLDLPAGCHKNGTEYQAKGQWRDVNLVRWRDGVMRPVGGFTIQGTAGVYSDTGLGDGDPATFGIGRPGGIAWTDNSGTKWVLFSMTLGAVVYSVANGRTYGLSSGLGANGEWTWDTFGQIPIGCNSTAGNIVEWDLNTANNLTAVTNAPTSCDGVVVTDERFIFALGAGGEPKRIEWCDRDDRTVWTPASTNQAGGWDLDTEGSIKFGLQMRGETLIVTTADAWRARYIGYPNVWEFHRIGPCTCSGANVGVRVGDAAYWMGDGEFYVYRAGYLERLPCPVSEFVFDNALTGGLLRFAWHNIEFGEVWFHFSQSDTTRPDSAAVYSYAENHWSLHEGLTFSAVVGRGVIDKPLAMNSNRNGVQYDFSSDPGFTLGTNWRIAGGVLDQSSPTASAASIAVATTDDHGYILRCTIANRSAGTLTVAAGADDIEVSTNGEVFLPFTATGGTTTVGFTGDGVWDGDVTIMSVTQEWIYALEDPDNLHYGDGIGDTTPFAETGPLEIGDGGRRVHITRLIPDEQDAGELTYTFKTREYPTATETSHSAIVSANPADVRVSGRQFKLRIAPTTTGTDFRVGVQRLEVVPGGRR
jgi:hypothetical protein